MNTANLIRIRHLVQWGILAFLVVLPLTGLFRIDVVSGSFRVGGFLIWWDDFAIVFGFWAMLFFSMTAFYSNFGMIFCGWFCPQHTLSEWLNNLIRRLLGRRVLVGISPERAAGRSKRKNLTLVLSWTLFGVLVVALSALLTASLLTYFMLLDVLWEHFVEGKTNIYVTVFAILIGTFVLIDLGLLRHFWCKYMCPYGLWQYMFRNRDTLQIRYDDARHDDCRSCTLCKDVCPVDLDPRQPEVYTRCINCAICIDACESYMGRFGKTGILSFGFGTEKQALIRIETGRSRVWVPGVLWPLTGVLAAALLFSYGIATFEPVKMGLSQADSSSHPTGGAGQPGLEFVASIRNKDSVPMTLNLAVEGLPAGQATVSSGQVTLAAGESVQVDVRVLQQGLDYDRPYPFALTATDTVTGAEHRAEVVYYLPRIEAS
ncbi:MAG: 4Fe-4S dicluster domain-containing protein [Leptospirillia bacterium]